MRNTTTGRFRGTTAELDAAARELRQRMTPVEKLLWRALRGHRLAGCGFRRQHPFGAFVIDFACPSRMLAIEVDGKVHDTQSNQDAARTEILESWGWTVIRFTNDAVNRDISHVLSQIEWTLEQLPIAPGHRGFEDNSSRSIEPPS